MDNVCHIFSSVFCQKRPSLHRKCRPERTSKKFSVCCLQYALQLRIEVPSQNYWTTLIQLLASFACLLAFKFCFHLWSFSVQDEKCFPSHCCKLCMKHPQKQPQKHVLSALKMPAEQLMFTSYFLMYYFPFSNYPTSAMNNTKKHAEEMPGSYARLIVVGRGSRVRMPWRSTRKMFTPVRRNLKF